MKAMSGSCHWAQSLNDGNGVQGLGAGVLSVGRGMVYHFLRMKVCHAGRSPRAHVFSEKFSLIFEQR